MSEDGVPVPFTPPAWLNAKADQRLALMSESVQEVLDETAAIVEQVTGTKVQMAVDVGRWLAGDIMMTPLTEPPEGSSKEVFDRWERSCDNCDAYVPAGDAFYTGQLVRDWSGTQVIIVFGICERCKDAP
jgi:hypothetical protein